MSTPLPRAEFAVTQQYVYLNHAAVGVLPASLGRGDRGFARAHAEARRARHVSLRAAARPSTAKRSARFIGATGNEIAIVAEHRAPARTSLRSARLERRATKCSLCDNEFPANAIPWLALRARGVARAAVPARSANA